MTDNDVACIACGARSQTSEQLLIRSEPVTARACPQCGLRFFADPTWLEAAYADPIADLDFGLASRCVKMAWVFEAIARGERLTGESFLDYGGGYGLLTRLVRDRGLNMRHLDPMSANLFALGFEGQLDRRYAMITMTEVLEHLTDPRATLAEIGAQTDYVLVTTTLIPQDQTSLAEWWYLTPDIGQHVTFWTVPSLRALGRSAGLRLTTNGRNLHLFHRLPLRVASRLVLREPRSCIPVSLALRARGGRRSLVDNDWAHIRELSRSNAVRSPAEGAHES